MCREGLTSVSVQGQWLACAVTPLKKSLLTAVIVIHPWNLGCPCLMHMAICHFLTWMILHILFFKIPTLFKTSKTFGLTFWVSLISVWAWICKDWKVQWASDKLLLTEVFISVPNVRNQSMGYKPAITKRGTISSFRHAIHMKSVECPCPHFFTPGQSRCEYTGFSDHQFASYRYCLGDYDFV